jgi:peptidoglycan/LPS O-acetylase OafA/YrhL
VAQAAGDTGGATRAARGAARRHARRSAASHMPPMTARNNFDLLRFFFAFSVFWYHAHVLSGAEALAPLSRFLSADVAVKAFFVASGYLVTMSYAGSSSVFDYAAKRARRLYPAYITVILLAVVLGAALTALPPGEYFGGATLRYVLWNALFLNFVAPTLPGTFTANPWTEVNGALWTLKIEVMFYALVPFMVWMCRRTRAAWVFAAIYVASALYADILESMAAATGSERYAQFARQLPGQLRYFVVGAAGWYLRDQWSRQWTRIALASAAGFLLARAVGSPTLTLWIEPAALGGLVLWAAFGMRYLGNFGRRGDLSYGIYIIHFPVLQAMIAAGLFATRPWLALAGATVVVLALAALSWHLVEKPFLRRSSHYRRAEAGRP